MRSRAKKSPPITYERKQQRHTTHITLNCFSPGRSLFTGRIRVSFLDQSASHSSFLCAGSSPWDLHHSQSWFESDRHVIDRQQAEPTEQQPTLRGGGIQLPPLCVKREPMQLHEDLQIAQRAVHRRGNSAGYRPVIITKEFCKAPRVKALQIHMGGRHGKCNEGGQGDREPVADFNNKPTKQ